MPYPSLLHPEPLSLRRSTADLYLHRMLKYSSVSVFVGFLGPGAHEVCLGPLSISGRNGFDSKGEFTPPTVLLGCLLCPLVWVISSQLLLCLPSYWGFFDLGLGVSPQGLSSDMQLPLLTLDVGYLLMAAPAKCSHHSCMKRQKDRTLKDELPKLVGAQYATGDQWRNNSRQNEEKRPKQKSTPSCGWDWR